MKYPAFPRGDFYSILYIAFCVNLRHFFVDFRENYAAITIKKAKFGKTFASSTEVAFGWAFKPGKYS